LPLMFPSISAKAVIQPKTPVETWMIPSVWVSSSSNEFIADPLSIMALMTDVFRFVPHMDASFLSLMFSRTSR